MSEDYSLPSIKPDLSLVPLDDLVREIDNRVDTSVVLLHFKDESPRGSCRYSGSYYTAVGLLETYKNDLIHLDLQNIEGTMDP